MGPDGLFCRLADAIDRQKAIGFLRAAAAGIARDRPAVVQVGDWTWSNAFMFQISASTGRRVCLALVRIYATPSIPARF